MDIIQYMILSTIKMFISLILSVKGLKIPLIQIIKLWMIIITLYKLEKFWVIDHNQISTEPADQII